jgi:ankyrin repeat protein
MFLIQAGVDLSQPTKHGCTPAFIASSHGHCSCLRALLDAGVVLDDADINQGRSIVSAAAFNGHTAVLSILKEAGADLHSADSTGSTPVLHAVMKGHLDCLVFLHKAGCKLDVADDNGVTAVFLAAYHGFIDVLRALLVLGAQQDALEPCCYEQDSTPMTPLEAARRRGHSKCEAELSKLVTGQLKTRSRANSSVQRRGVAPAAAHELEVGCFTYNIGVA